MQRGKPKKNRTKRLKKMKNVFYKCVLNPILHLYPVWEAPFCKKKAKPLYPNAQVQTMVQFQVLSEVEAQENAHVHCTGRKQEIDEVVNLFTK